MAAELDRLNRERQIIEVETVAQAEAEAMAALGIEEKGASSSPPRKAGTPASSASSRRG